jgi:hypothetical protein
MSNESKALELVGRWRQAISQQAHETTGNAMADELERQNAEIESLRAQLAARVPNGCAMVPVEPTREMRNAAIREQELHRNMSLGLYGDEPASAIYRAMLSAAPSQQAPHCATCNDNGLIGGPSYYAPDEGGVPCPDCSQQAPHPGSQAEYEQWSRDGSPIPDTQQAPVHGEPVAWKHDCAALLQNDVELWVERCPHCGKPKDTTQQQASKPMTEEQAYDLFGVHYQMPTIRAVERFHKIGERINKTDSQEG